MYDVQFSIAKVNFLFEHVISQTIIENSIEKFIKWDLFKCKITFSVEFVGTVTFSLYISKNIIFV